MTVEVKTPRNSPSHYGLCSEGSESIFSGGGSWEKLSPLSGLEQALDEPVAKSAEGLLVL